MNIDAKLREMAKDAWAKAGDPMNSLPGAAIQEAVEKAYALGFEEAKKKALRVAINGGVQHSQWLLANIAAPSLTSESEFIIAQIRALKPEVGE